MNVCQLAEKILLAEREMMTIHPKHHRDNQEQANSAKKQEKGKNKKGKGKSDIVDSTLTPIINPNLKNNKWNSNYYIQA